MKKAFGVGRVQDGRISFISTNGVGYSRPVVRTANVNEEVAATSEVAKEVKTTTPDVSIDMMPWVKDWSDRKRVDYVPPKPPKKPSLLSRLAQYIKEEFI